MMKPNDLRWLPAMLLGLILLGGSARLATAQAAATYNIGDIVEFHFTDQTGPIVWMKGKIVTTCIVDTCGVLKWNPFTNDWMDGSIHTYVGNIRRPGAPQFAPPPLASPHVSANAQVIATYKIGDGIELLAGSALIGERYVGGTWQPGTIVNVTQTANGMMYLVHYDENQDSWVSSPQIRAHTGLISETEKVRRELASLGALKAPNAGSLDEIFQNLIRENCATRGGRFPVTVNFQGFVIGQTHPYGRPDVYGESQDGPGGSAGTLVYPVRAKYYYRVAHPDAFLTFQQDEVFKCFKNSFGSWQCNLASGGTGMVKQFREQRAAIH